MLRFSVGGVTLRYLIYRYLSNIVLVRYDTGGRLRITMLACWLDSVLPTGKWYVMKTCSS